MNEKTPLASVIVLTWNGLNFIKACLDSVLAQTYPEVEIVVVDNASSDGTADFVAQNYPTTRLTRNEDNLGFAAGVNIGLTQATGEFLVLLNQDTVVEANWLAELIGGMLTDSQVGIGGCKIFDWSGEKIWHAGVVLDEARRLPLLYGFGETDQGQYDQPAEMVAIVGAALAIRRELLQTVGFFDEEYYFYLEDTDYCFRARKAGYKVMYYPRAVLRHYIAASLKKDSYEVLYRFHLSRLLFLLKHYDVDWFCHGFVPAEKKYLTHWISLNEFKALRRVYMETAFQIATGAPRYMTNLTGITRDKNQVDDLLQALADLRNCTLAFLYEPKDWQGSLSRETEDKWRVKEFEFKSNTPILGSLLTGFRRWWSSIAVKWIERHLINQQNAINQNLVTLLEAQLGFISTLDTEISFLQAQLLDLSQRQATNALSRKCEPDSEQLKTD